MVGQISLGALLLINLQAGFRCCKRGFPAAAKNWPLFKGKAGLRVLFDHLFHYRRQTAAVNALIIKEFNDRNFALFRAVGWRIFILGQRGRVLQYRLGRGAGLLLLLNLLQLLAGLQQHFRMRN